jgi:hypothetical protein
MRRRSVRSSCLRSIGHDPEARKLEVEFKKSGAVYQYDGPSKRVASNLEKAGSIGRHFNRNIKHDYPYTKIHGGKRKRRVRKR